MHEQEALLIEVLNKQYPGWREAYRDAFEAAGELLPPPDSEDDYDDYNELEFDDD